MNRLFCQDAGNSHLDPLHEYETQRGVSATPEFPLTCGAPIARSMTQTTKFALRANDQCTNSVCVTDLAIGARRKGGARICLPPQCGQDLYETAGRGRGGHNETQVHQVPPAQVRTGPATSHAPCSRVFHSVSTPSAPSSPARHCGYKALFASDCDH